MSGGAPSRRRRAVILSGYRDDPLAAGAALADADPGVRVAAIGALERLGALSADHVEACLNDGHPAVRRRACEAAARLAGDGRPSLLGALSDRDATVVEVAAWASGERDPAEPRVTEALARLATDHPDALVREAAVAALGAIGDPIGLPAIIAATRDKATVRRRAVLALAPFEGPEVDAALARAADDRDWQVRQAADDLRDP